MKRRECKVNSRPVKASRKSRSVTLCVVGAALTVIVITALVHREKLIDLYRLYRIGYRFVWMPEGVRPSGSTSHTINNAGEVAVVSGKKAGRWSTEDEKVTFAPTVLGAGESALAFSINEHSVIIGSHGRDPLARGYVWAPDSPVRDIGSLGGHQTVPLAINELNHVVGWAAGNGSAQNAFLWSPEGGMKGLGSLSAGTESQALGINEKGWVVGGAVAGDGEYHPFLWTAESGMKDLGLRSGYRSGFASVANLRGEVLVNLAMNWPLGVTSGRVLCEPFLWTEEDGFVPLPLPSGYDDVRGVGLNGSGVVVLRARRKQGLSSTGYLVSDGKLVELPDAFGALDTRYDDINDRGWLVGSAVPEGLDPRDGDSRRGFVAKPVW